MINYKQILEAVNRGIKFALSDLEDDEELSSIGSQKQNQIEDKSYTRELLDLKKEVVDLGLPSGTLWCKYNLGVDPKQISKAEDWYGDYYAWGDPEPNKASWGEKDYKFTGKMLKYNNDDGLTNLFPEDDQATQFMHIHNFKFHIPTKEQCEELIQYTTPSELQNNYNEVVGLSGYILISKINGKTIFLPKAGYMSWTGFTNNWAGVACSTRHKTDPYKCYVLQYYSRINGFILNDVLYRTCGFPIRPVINL